MADYIYLLENRLSADQQNALRLMRDAAREAEMLLFLTGDAVRDLTSGHAVRDLEVVVQGNALKLKKIVEKVGAKVWGEDGPSCTLFLCFPGTVRVDVVSAHSVEYKKPGQPTYQMATIQEDLRRRDFTVNAMAISLNEGSYGLLMDPLNGVADIEARTLRLVSNYGFIEEPALMIRATRYRTRLGWELDPRTQTRYENSKGEDHIQYLSPLERSRELEQIGHEDDGLKVLHALEAEGWMKVLCAQWTAAKADEPRLKALHDLVVELLLQGVRADTSAAQMQLLTAKMSPKDLAGLKKSMLRPGFVEEWNTLDQMAAGFSKVLLAKENQTPSQMFKLFTSYDPEAILWLGFTSKESAVKDRFNRFLKVWPEVRQQIPYALMQEMRIRPELANYGEIVHAIFLQLIDGNLSTPEEMRAFLEPYSPPAPPPQVTVKRPRGRRAEPKAKETFDDEDEEGEESDSDEDLDDMGGDDDAVGLGSIPKIDLRSDEDDDEGGESDAEESDDEDDEEEDEEPVRGKRGPKPGTKPVKAAAPAAPPAVVKAPKAEPVHAPAEAAKAMPAHKPAAKAASAPPPAAVAKQAAASKHSAAAPAKATGKAAAGKAAAESKDAKKGSHSAKPEVKKAALKPPAKAHKSVAPVKGKPAHKAAAAQKAPAKKAPAKKKGAKRH